MAIPQPEKRIAAFEKLGFGMFIHWGLYSQLCRGEWVMDQEHIPVAEYKQLTKTFTAEKFDARKIVRIAKEAGCKYITLTTRHHEGFSLYDTCGLNTYDAPHSACGRDLIREYVDACNEEGIKPFFYHTTLDWHHPDFKDNFPKYLEYLRESVKVLCTQYGPIGGLWFDGNWSKPAGTDWEEDKLYAVIRKYQPEAMIINNTGLGELGKVGNPELDSVTFEQGRPEPMNREGMSKYVAAEMCQTLNEHWGTGSLDFQYKSLPSLIENLCNCRRVGANYLLNVGPSGAGEITFYQHALMASIGEWIHAIGDDPIYEGKPSGVHGVTNGKDFALKNTDGTKLWFFVHELQFDGRILPREFNGVGSAVKSIRWTDSGENLDFEQKGEAITIQTKPYPYGKRMVVRVAEATL